MSSPNDAFVLGVGLTKFIKPRQLRPYPELGFEAGIKALTDSHINYDAVDAGVACFAYGETTSGQRVFYQFGMTNIPIYNTNNACATGSTGLHLARTVVRGGMANVVMVVGFETMQPGAIKSDIGDGRPSALGIMTRMMEETRGKHDSPRNAQFFANAGREYMEEYGASARDFAELARISHQHSSRNPYTQLNNVYSLEEIEQSTMIHYPLTKLQCSPTSGGAGAAIIVSRRAIDLVGHDMTRRATRAALSEARILASQIRVCEIHDCFSTNEVILLDGLGFCKEGQAHHMVRNGDITYGGQVVVNPSDGLISKGHPLGAIGLAQCAELTWQLRGWANNGRLVQNIGVALQHNLGLGGAVVVTVYKRADGRQNTDIEVQQTEAEIAERSGLGYNPAVEVRGITREMVEKVRSLRGNDYALGDTARALFRSEAKL